MFAHNSVDALQVDRGCLARFALTTQYASGTSVGRDFGDVVAHDRRAFGDEEVALSQVVTISYEMGTGRVSSHRIGRRGMEL